MFKKLEIQNYILFENEQINFSNTTNILTGETGSGKSILISAIKFISGGKASSDIYLDKEKSVKVKVILDASLRLKEKLKEITLDDQVDVIEIVRTLTPAKKNQIRINGELVTLKELKMLLDGEINIFSQHDSSELRRKTNYTDIVDNFIDEKIKDEYLELFNEYAGLKKIQKEIEAANENKNERLEIIEFRLANFKNINVDINIEELITEKEEFEAKKHDSSAYESLEKTLNKIASEIEPKCSEIQNEKINTKLNELLDLVNDISYDVANASTSFDEERYQQISQEISDIKMISRKLKKDPTEIREYKESLENEKNQLESFEMDYANIVSKISKVEKKLSLLAEKLSTERKKQAIKLETKLIQELKDLEMKDASIKISFTKREYSNDGIDNIQVLVNFNVKEEFHQLDKAASGGELSRVMLALKKISSKKDNSSLLIFDEIDTGVSGKVASKMALKMKDIAKDNQEIIITHLPQVASLGDTHFKIKKVKKQDKVVSKIETLSSKERTKEIAALISTDEITNEAIMHAQQLIDNI